MKSHALWCRVLISSSVCSRLVSCSSVSCAVCACVFSSALTMTRNNSINKPPVTHIIRSSRVIDTWRNQSSSRADVRFCAWAASGIDRAYRQVQTQTLRGHDKHERHWTSQGCMPSRYNATFCYSKHRLYPVYHPVTHSIILTHTLAHPHTQSWLCTVRLACMGPECRWPISAFTHKQYCARKLWCNTETVHIPAQSWHQPPTRWPRCPEKRGSWASLQNERTCSSHCSLY